MEYLLTAIDGVLRGLLIAGVASGFGLVFGICNILNLAHGGFIVVGAYMSYALGTELGLSPFVALPVVVAVAFVTSWLIFRYGGIERVTKGPLYMLIAYTFGLNLIVVSVISLVFGGSGRAADLPSWLGHSIELGNLQLTVATVVAAAGGLLLVGVLAVVLHRTKLGRAIRATRLDPGMAISNGVDVGRASAAAFAIGCSAAAAGGVLLILNYPFTPYSGQSYLVTSFTVVILAGLGRIDAIVLGALVYTVVLSEASLVLGSEEGQVLTLLAVLVLLLVKPRGLFGSEYY